MASPSESASSPGPDAVTRGLVAALKGEEGRSFFVGE